MKSSAVVIGGDLNGLGVCRSLVGAGVPTYVLDHKILNPAMWSRHVTAIKTSINHGPKLLDTLRSLQVNLNECPVLIITDELALLTISEFRYLLEGLYRFHLPSHEMVMVLHDKALFHEFAVANDLPVPMSVILRGVSARIRRMNWRF
jgi:D-aspartate ligase